MTLRSLACSRMVGSEGMTTWGRLELRLNDGQWSSRGIGRDAVPINSLRHFVHLPKLHLLHLKRFGCMQQRSGSLQLSVATPCCRMSTRRARVGRHRARIRRPLRRLLLQLLLVHLVLLLLLAHDWHRVRRLQTLSHRLLLLRLPLPLRLRMVRLLLLRHLQQSRQP